MSTVPTFIVGHMSGENWDPAWRGGRDLYPDVWMVARQAWFAGEMVRRFGAHPAVCGWLVSNEMPIYGGEERAAGGRRRLGADHQGRGARGGRPAAVLARRRRLGHRAQRPVTPGSRLADTAAAVRLPRPARVPRGRRRGPPALRGGLALRARRHVRPAGRCSRSSASARTSPPTQNAARYYRQVLHNSLLAGATGWIGWCNSDYDDLAGQDPYRHHAFELHFGLTDAAGAPSRTLAEMKAFAATLRAVDIGRCQRAAADTALVVPSYLDTSYPFTAPDDRAHIYDSLRQAYVCGPAGRPAGGAGQGEPGHRRRRRALPACPRSSSCSRPPGTSSSGWPRAARRSTSPTRRAHDGWHRGPSYGRLNAMFGVEHQLGAGLVDPIEDDVGDVHLPPGLRHARRPAPGSTFRAGGNEHSRAYLPVRPDGAEVLATDGHGRPALLLRRVGRGLAGAVHLPRRAHGRR